MKSSHQYPVSAPPARPPWPPRWSSTRRRTLMS